MGNKIIAHLELVRLANNQSNLGNEELAKKLDSQAYKIYQELSPDDKALLGYEKVSVPNTGRFLTFELKKS